MDRKLASVDVWTMRTCRARSVENSTDAAESGRYH